MAPTRKRTGTKGRRQTRARPLFQMVGGGADDKYVLLSCPEFDDVVDEIMIKDGASPELFNPAENIEQIRYNQFLKNTEMLDEKKTIDRFVRKDTIVESPHFYRGYINWSSFADKSPAIKMSKDTTLKIRGAKVIFLLYLTFNEQNATSIIDQFIFLNSLSHYGIDELNIVLPYFPVGTMERIVGEGEIPIAHSLAQMLNSIPEGSAKTNLYMFDIHALCSRFFFHTNIRPILLSMMDEYISHINEKYAGQKNIIVFPDDGAKKRFEKLIEGKGFETITCAKKRIGGDRVIRIEEGLEHIAKEGVFIDTAGTNINLFVIDDLVQTGGTQLKTMDGIKASLPKVSVSTPVVNYIPIVTHAVFPDSGKEADFFKNRGADKVTVTEFITTDSRPLKAAQLKKDYNKQVTIRSIAGALQQIFSNKRDATYITPYILN